MKVLVACEESQTVCKAFRALGHEAYSNDIQECSGGHPEWHLQMDALEAIGSQKWDLLIGHPPCTYLSFSGYGSLKNNPERLQKRHEAMVFFMKLWNSGIPKICLENPQGYPQHAFRKPNQIIHPYYFGDNDLKRTCLWLRGLSRLNGNPNINHIKDKPKPSKVYIRKTGKKAGGTYSCYFHQKAGTGKKRSKTFPGIAKAMAEQWGKL